MRKTLRAQPTLTESWLDPRYAEEPNVITDLLDEQTTLVAFLAQNVSKGTSK